MAGGAESMSRGQYWLPSLRWGQRMQDGVAVDAVVGALTDPFDSCHMGVTAENVATEFHISRGDQDALAAESHRRAAAAAQAGYFDEQITPVPVRTRKGTTSVATDEHVRPGVTVDDLAKLRPAFAADGTVTAGNASGINDAAAAVVLADAAFASRRGLQPLGRLVAYSHAGVGVSLGHPIGATGAILTVKALYELRRTGGRYALVTMCIGGGQGIAAIFERA